MSIDDVLAMPPVRCAIGGLDMTLHSDADHRLDAAARTWVRTWLLDADVNCQPAKNGDQTVVEQPKI